MSATPGSPGAAVELERLRTRSESTRSLIQYGKASTLTLADRVLVVVTGWDHAAGDLSIRENFYEWKDGKLVHVPLVDPPK